MAKILAIDDNPDNLISIKALIGEAFPDALLLQATSGAIGFEMAQHHDPDVILLDIIMPGMDGFEVCRRLKSNPMLREIPVVFLTALKGDKESRIKALECGGEAFLAKPIDETELKAQIRAMVKIKQSNIEKRDEKARLAAVVQERTQQLQQELEERKKTEEALIESQLLLKSSMESFKETIVLSINQQYQYLYFNSFHKDVMLIAYGKEVMLGMNLLDCIPIEDDKIKAKNNYDRALKGESHTTIEEYGDLERYFYETKYNPIINDKNEVIGATAFSSNITERMKAEKELKENEERFKHIFESANVGKSITLPMGEINVNQAFCDMLGYTKEELENKKWQDITPVDDIELTQEIVNALLKGEKNSARFNKRYLHKNGSLIWTDVSVTLLRDQHGKPLHFITTIIDITERLRIEEALRKSEELFKCFVQNSSDLTTLTDENDAVLFVSPQCESILGFSGTQFIGQKMPYNIHHEDAGNCFQLWERLKTNFEEISDVEYRILNNDGTQKWVSHSAKLVKVDSAVLGFQSTIHDITERKVAEEALRMSEEKHRTLFEQASDGIFIADSQGNYIDVNSSGCAMLGYSHDEIVKLNIRDIVTSESLAKNELKLNELKKGGIIIAERELRCKDGSTLPVEISGKIMPDGRYQGIVRDITERIKAEQALQASEAQFREFFEKAADAIFIAEIESGIVVDANEAASQLMLRKHDELVGIHQTELHSPVMKDYSIESFREQNEKIKNTIRANAVENSVVRADGSEVPVEILASEVVYHGKRCMLGTFRDITQRKKSEEALRESEEKYRLLHENAGIGIGYYKTDGSIISFNQIAAKNMNGKPEDFIGKTIYEIFPKQEAQFYHERIKQAALSDKSAIYEDLVQLPTGNKYFLSVFSKICDSENNISGIQIVSQDITEQKQSETALIEINDLLSKFISNSPIYAFIKEVTPTESRVLKASENYIDMVGIPGSQMNGKTMEELFPPEFAAKITADDWLVASKGQLIVLDEELNGRYYTTIKFPINEGEKVLLAGYTIDVTTQKQTEMELRKLSRALEQSPDSILITNTKGEIEFVNPSLVRLSGYTASELMGKNPRIFKSGETTTEEYKELWDTIKAGYVWEGELHNRKKNGDLFWESTTISPVFDAAGKITHYLAIRKDISEQKRMTNELIEAKNHAEESDRLKSAFLANMSHEIRTPMNSIMGFASLLPEEESRELLIQYANIIVQNSEQLVSLIDSLVIYSKLQSGLFVYRPSNFDVHRLLADVQQSFNLPIYQNGVILKSECNLLANTQVFSDYDKLRQIINNLITNAFKYTPQGEITMGCNSSPDGFVFYIKDTGIGIPKKDIDHIFERFYRGSNINESSTRGTGLGLCIVKELVEMLGGKIFVESEVGKGSTFYFSIPTL